MTDAMSFADVRLAGRVESVSAAGEVTVMVASRHGAAVAVRVLAGLPAAVPGSHVMVFGELAEGGAVRPAPGGFAVVAEVRAPAAPPVLSATPAPAPTGSSPVPRTPAPFAGRPPLVQSLRPASPSAGPRPAFQSAAPRQAMAGAAGPPAARPAPAGLAPARPPGLSAPRPPGPPCPPAFRRPGQDAAPPPVASGPPIRRRGILASGISQDDGPPTDGDGGAPQRSTAPSPAVPARDGGAPPAVGNPASGAQTLRKPPAEADQTDLKVPW